MTTLDTLKTHIRTLAGAPCMVRTDRRGRALFFSDFPLRADADAVKRLTEAGFDIRLLAEGALINPGFDMVMKIYLALPTPPSSGGPDLLHAAAALLSRHETPSDCQSGDVLLRGLLLALTGKREALCELMYRALSDALRTGEPVPCLLARLTHYF